MSKTPVLLETDEKRFSFILEREAVEQFDKASGVQLQDLDIIEFLGETCGISADEFSEEKPDSQINPDDVLCDDDIESGSGDIPLSWEQRLDVIQRVKENGWA